MGQSLVQNYIHIVFSTKYRAPIISEDIETSLFSYLGGICNLLECNVIIVGGYRNHVHILCLLSPKITIAKLVQELKVGSSKWIKTKDPKFRHFYWQNGYGAFSAYHKNLDIIIKYISNQKEHHQKMTFEKEYIAFLNNYNIPYNELYVWD